MVTTTRRSKNRSPPSSDSSDKNSHDENSGIRDQVTEDNDDPTNSKQPGRRRITESDKRREHFAPPQSLSGQQQQHHEAKIPIMSQRSSKQGGRPPPSSQRSGSATSGLKTPSSTVPGYSSSGMTSGEPKSMPVAGGDENMSLMPHHEMQQQQKDPYSQPHRDNFRGSNSYDIQQQQHQQSQNDRRYRQPSHGHRNSSPHAHDDHSNTHTHTPNKKGGLIGRDVPPPYGSIAAELDMETKDADDVFDLFNEKEVPSPRSTSRNSNSNRANPKPEKKRSNSRLDSVHKENDYPPAGNPPESRYAQNPQSSPETGPQYPHPYHPYPSPPEGGPHGAHPYSQGYYPPGAVPPGAHPHTQLLSSPYHQQYPAGGVPYGAPHPYGFQPSPHEGYYPGYHRPPFGGPAAPYGNYLWSPQAEGRDREREPKRDTPRSREESRREPHFRERTKTPPLPPKELKSPPTPRADNVTPGRKRPNMLGLALSSPPKKRPSLTATVTHPPFLDRNQLTPERSPPFGVSLSRDSRDDGGFQPVDTPLLYNNYFGSMGDVDTPGNLSAVGGLPEVRGTSSAMLTFSPVGGNVFGNEGEGALTPYRDGAATHPTRKKREFPESPFSMFTGGFTGGQLSPLKQAEEFDERGTSRYKGPPPSLINSMDKNYKGRRITPRSDKSQGRYESGRGPSLRRLDDPITPHRDTHRVHDRDSHRDMARSKPDDQTKPNSNTFDGDRSGNASIILKIGNMGGLQRQNMDGINSVLRGSPVKPSRQSSMNTSMNLSLSSSNHSDRDRLGGHSDKHRHHPNTIMSSSHSVTTTSTHGIASTPAKDRDRTPSFRPQRSPMGHANVHHTSSTPQYRHAVTPFPPLTTPSSASSKGGNKNQEEDGGKSHRRNPCNCKRSKCLKLYCECFAAERYCSGCNCQDCNNIEQFEHLRSDAIKATRAKNPNAFKPRFDAQKAGLNTPQSSRAGHLLSQTPLSGAHHPSASDTGHNMGCRCKKSACLKKYCECFEAGYMCGEKCKCIECQNYIGSQQLIDRRRKIKDHKGAEMAMRSADDAWKNRRRKEEPRNSVVSSREVTKVAATPQPRHPMYRSGPRPSPSGSPYAPSMMMHHMNSPPGYSPSPHMMHHPPHPSHGHAHHGSLPPYHHSQYPPSGSHAHPPTNRQVTPGYGTHPSNRYPRSNSITSPYSQNPRSTRRPPGHPNNSTPLSGGRTASAVKRLGFDAYSSKKHRRVSKPGEERTTAVFGHRVAPQPKTTALSIFSFLNNDELYNACLVSKQWTSLSLDEELWQF